jgi:serine/threonine protein kinase/tetratricopeptide (TPR) repeat protein
MASPLDRLRNALAGRYRIERELGQGGMATVYLAYDERHHRQVAVKVLRTELASSLGPERFLREIRIAANLTHPHIVPVFDSGQIVGSTDRGIAAAGEGSADLLFYVMPYIEGETLGQRLKRTRAIPIAEAVTILREVSDALSFAHARGVVHRDIKPDNVMLSDRHAVVTDFGVAKAVAGATTAEGLTNVGIAVGTPAYMAPEQVAADPHVDHRADIYALGTLAYELLSGRPPFQAASPQQVLAAHVTQTPDPVSTHCGDLPRDLETAVMRCLEKNPADRWQSADDLWQALGALGTGSGAAAVAGKAKKRAIVVLPFANQSADPENEFFSDGLTEEIIADLAKVHALSVISRTSSMQLKGTDKDVRTIGRELGVRYALEGSVRKAGQSLRITAQLIDALSDAQLWAGKYGGTMDDVFDLQERVSREIVRALDVTLSSDEDRRLADRPVADPRAFELFLQVRQEIRRYNVTDQVQALLGQAIAIEGRTPALKALEGWANLHIVRSGRSTDRHELDTAAAIAHELLAEAPDTPHGHHILGYVAYEQGRNADAVHHFEAAVARAPNDADSLFMLGIVYVGSGLAERGEEFAQRLVASDPLSPLSWQFAGSWLWFVGRAAEGVEKQAVSLRLDASNLIVRWCTGYNDALAGRVAEAAVHADWLQANAADVAYTKQLGALVAALQGRPETARTILADLNTGPLDAHTRFHLSESFAMAGDTDRALDLLEQAVEGGFHPDTFIAEYCPFLAPLRDHPRFPAIADLAKARARVFREAIARSHG